jgi:co-chaperonin GroES (HSP10)
MNKETLSTSEKEIPKHRNALSEKYKEEAKGEPEPLNPENIQKQKEQLPEPSGWRLLVLPFTPKEKTKGGIITNCGYVLKVGPLAYYDKEKFPTGAWCKKGDWVIFARYAGSRLPIEGGEVRLLNDDEVLGTINNPESVLHNI